MHESRALSGMRPTGRLHLGHYHGVLKNWAAMQREHQCFFFVADFHAFTTHYADSTGMDESVREMLIGWLAAGINPDKATIFMQSQIPAHAELHLLLSMICPISWLTRVPTYKEQQEQMSGRDLNTYGFLGYPLLQSADILIYRANVVPVGDDQVPHVEFAREIARRFNFLYGRDADFESRAAEILEKLTANQSRVYLDLRRRYQENGDESSLQKGREMVGELHNLSREEIDRLQGYLEGGGRIVLTEPQALLTKSPRFPGIDGRKMSKSYDNAIEIFESAKSVDEKIRRMQTDPARKRRSDKGNPDKCPVWPLHEIYSSDETRDWVRNGCTTAAIGCLECKRAVIEKINAQLEPVREAGAKFREDKTLVRDVLSDGANRARKAAAETLSAVRDAMGVASL